MKKILQQYGFVKVVEKLSLRTDRYITWVNDATFEPAPSIPSRRAKERYLRRHPWTRQSRVNKICRGALESGYIEIGDKQGAMADAIRITDKGTDLIDTVLFIPIGLLMAWWGKFGQFLAGAGIGTIVSALLRAIAHKYNLHLPL